MKVFHLISSGGMYGAEAMLLNLTHGLTRLGCEVIAGVFDNRDHSHLEIAAQIKKHKITVEIIPCMGRVDFSALLRIREFIRANKFDIIHCHGYKADIYAFFTTRFCDIPILATSHGWTGKNEVPAIYNKLDRMVLRRFCRVAAVSGGVEDKLKESGVPANRVVRISNGVDLAPFETMEMGGATQSTRNDLVFAMIGRLVKEKGCDYFLRAAAKVLSHFPQSKFLVVGEGPEKENLRQLTADLKIEESVTFLGFCSDMPAVYASMDVCVLPSFLEAMPMTIMEAMAAGKAIVATNVGEIPRMVTPEVDGLLVPAGRVNELCFAMTRILNDSSLRLKMGEQARTRARESFSANAMARAYLSLYDQVMDERQRQHIPLWRKPEMRSSDESRDRKDPSTNQLAEIQDLERRRNRRVRVYMMDLWSFIPYYIGQLCCALKREGADVNLCSSQYHLDRGYFRRIGLATDPFLLDRGGAIKSVRIRRLLKSCEYVINLLVISLRIAVARPDIAHLQYMPFLERSYSFEIWFMKWIRLLGIPTVYTVHNVTPQNEPNRHLGRYRRVYNLADALICHGSEARTQLIEEFSIPSEKIQIIPHGPLFADKPRISTDTAKETVGANAEEALVLCLGVISEYKGIPFLLEVWKRVMEFGVKGRLLIAGTGDERLLSSIRQYVIANKLEDCVDLRLRFIAVEEIPLLHQAADVLVYPYMSGTTSGALLTGMNYEKAIVATTLPFFREHLRDGENAMLVPYGDVEGWSRALAELLMNRNARQKLGESVQTAGNGDRAWGMIARETLRCYDAVRFSPPKKNATERDFSLNESMR